jgi:hypothetical protein
MSLLLTLAIWVGLTALGMLPWILFSRIGSKPRGK